MPIEGHPENCECCVVRIERAGGKRTREDADLEHFLPPEAELEEGEEGAGGEEGEEGAEGEEGEEGGEEAAVEDEDEDEDELISNALFAKFEKHVGDIQRARAARQELLSFKSALEEDSGQATADADASLDEIDSMGIWLPEDTMQGDVNMRTLDKLLTRVDQRGFERYARAAPLRFGHALATLWPRFGHALATAFPCCAMPWTGRRSNWSFTSRFSRRRRASSTVARGRRKSPRSCASTGGRRATRKF